ncbi:TATA-box-binding protein [Halobacteriaceae archaeon SHR40]|uniref:TATA-box-binding protein n=1 Tax=Halovenus amylolytica TaxID=2500550 RepID=UPI000FE3D946
MLESQKVETVNIVASGRFNIELDLAAVAEDLRELDRWIDEVEHSRNNGNRLLIDFTNNEARGILSPSGVYVFTGAKNHEKIDDARSKLSESLSTLGIISSSNPTSDEIIDVFETQNVVCTADLRKEINLNAIAIGLGLENTEYEPEQFPGVIYRPDNHSCTILLFATGKVVITGVQNKDTAQQAFDQLENRLKSLLS